MSHVFFLTIETFPAQFACNLSARYIAAHSNVTRAENVDVCSTFTVEKYIGLKNEKEGYLCKQVHFDGKTHVITTLERQKIVVK